MSRRNTALAVLLLSLAGLVLSLPPQWYPRAVKLQLAAWFGPPEYRPAPPSSKSEPASPEAYCPEDIPDWRAAYDIEGVEVRRAPQCRADNPWLVAASVRGTNRVSEDTLVRSGLTRDAVTKGADTSGRWKYTVHWTTAAGATT